MKIGCVQVGARGLAEYHAAAEDVYSALRSYGPTHDMLVFPECVYPAYFLDDTAMREEAVAKTPDFLAEVSRLAREHQTYVAVGVALRGEDGLLYNAAVLISSRGQILGQANKQHLWHFDSNWFTEGDQTLVVDTEFGPVGVVVCADARMPEIVREAALKGARLILDCANLTASGTSLSDVSNAQIDYLLAVRAFENGVWIAMADKWGVEGEFATYAGNSAVYAPDGRRVAAAQSMGSGVVSYDIPLVHGRLGQEPWLTAMERRVSGLSDDLSNTHPVARSKVDDAVKVGEVNPFVTVVAGSSQSCDRYPQLAFRLWQTETDLVCWPPMSDEALQALDCCSNMPEHGAAVAAVDAARGMDVYVNEGGKGWELLSTHTPIVQFHWGSLGVLRDDDIYIPELARCLMLMGVDAIYWPHRARSIFDLSLARARAMENRVFVCATEYNAEDGNSVSLVIDPAGGVAARTLVGQPLHASQVFMPCALARLKDVVPGTNVLTGRKPERYSLF
ncbi:MAG: hypothetical protein M1272_02930 [Firmicutes bacterium]|nr:hypothetical protein [Bacillota bacterium]